MSPRYAVVRSHGCYSDSETVYAARVSATCRAAYGYAAQRTREYQAAMRRHGGSSGGYRVVEVAPDATVRTVRWTGAELDATPCA